jgi:hypothetical protein
MTQHHNNPFPFAAPDTTCIERSGPLRKRNHDGWDININLSTLALLILAHLLTMAGIVWAAASSVGSVTSRLSAVEAQVTGLAAAMKESNRDTNLTIQAMASTLMQTTTKVDERTSKLETRAQTNWNAISRQGKESQANRSAIDRQGQQQQQQATQQTMDRTTAASADQRQTARADQSATRQAAAETNAATAESALSNQQDRDRQVNNSEARLQTAGQDRLRAQQDIDRAKQGKKGK